jgi:hypothetical protein
VDRLVQDISIGGFSHCDMCHLQISNPWQDPLSRDHMIGQEKLVPAKGRAELLFP